MPHEKWCATTNMGITAGSWAPPRGWEPKSLVFDIVTMTYPNNAGQCWAHILVIGIYYTHICSCVRIYLYMHVCIYCICARIWYIYIYRCEMMWTQIWNSCIYPTLACWRGATYSKGGKGNCFLSSFHLQDLYDLAGSSFAPGTLFKLAYKEKLRLTCAMRSSFVD